MQPHCTSRQGAVRSARLEASGLLAGPPPLVRLLRHTWLHYYSARDREEPYYSARDREEPPSQLHHHIIPISFGSLLSVEYHVNLNPHVPHESSPSQPSWAITGHPVPLTWPSRLPWSFMMYRLLVIQTYPRNIPLFSIVLISPGPTGGARGVDARPTLRRSVCYPASYCPR